MHYRAFVSSTYRDLEGHRNHAIAALRKAGISVDPMEDWTAASEEPKQFSRDRVAGCDLCVLLVAFRRGHVPEGERESITELEYRAAVRLGLDVLPFVLDEQAAWPRHFDELDSDPAIRAWRAELIEYRGVQFFTTAPESLEIAPALTRWMTRRTMDASNRINSTLQRSGVTERTLLQGTNEVGGEVRTALAPMMEELRVLLQGLDRVSTNRTDPQIHLQMGKALAASHEWLESAEHLRAYLESEPDHWEVHFLRGVALANSRHSELTNRDALRAYGEVIALVPSDIDSNLRARLHTYRGAIFKRLRRYAEAESEFMLAKRWAAARYERDDLAYNFATLYALRGDREKMLEHLSQIPSSKRRYLRSHPYFAEFWDDAEFLRLVDPVRT